VDERQVVWEADDNLRHLLVDNADRGITAEDVEAVLKDPATAIAPLGNGHDRYTGRTVSGRALQVIGMGEREVYPKSAWWVTEDEWRRAR